MYVYMKLFLPYRYRFIFVTKNRPYSRVRSLEGSLYTIYTVYMRYGFMTSSLDFARNF